MLTKLKKLRGRSVEELRVRAAQLLAAHAERHNLSSQTRLPSDAAFFKMVDAKLLSTHRPAAEDLLEHFRTRTSPGFFASFGEPDKTLQALRNHFGTDIEAATVGRADRIIANRFDLLGLKELNFGDPINWHLEPVSGKQVPAQLHWSRINYLDAAVAGDKKIIWELNRHQYFAALGQAYWYTRDERYAEAFIRHIQSWMQHNPPKFGINWASSLEVAFRAISWMWALYYFKASPQLTPAIYLDILKFLYLHARHLETYLSTYFSPNTHLTGEALGLFYLGTLLPELQPARRWRETGVRVLLSQLDRHVKPDGVYFEQATYYHRYTTDFYLHLLILAQANNISVGDTLKEKLRGLLDHLMYITRPDGTTPYFGDDDGGRLVMLDVRPANDFRATLATGAALLARPDYKYVAGAGVTAEMLWLLGPRGLEGFDNLDAHQAPAQTSQAFADGGYYVMRDGWASSANYLMIDCGPHGADNCGHAHADALSFELAAAGRTLLVDPGTYTYTGSAEMRDLFRTSHNTLTIDQEPSSVPGPGPFTWKHIAEARPHRWISGNRFDYFEGSHNGYERRASNPVKHTRSVLFCKGDYWIMRDWVAAVTAAADASHNSASQTQRCDLNFHFAADARPLIATHEQTAGFVREGKRKDEDVAGLDIVAFGSNGRGNSCQCQSEACRCQGEACRCQGEACRCQGEACRCQGEACRWQSEDGWASDCYGARRKAPALACSMMIQAGGDAEFVTFLLPHPARQAAAVGRSVQAIPASAGGQGFVVSDNQGDDRHHTRDVVLVGNGQLVEGDHRVASDFEWTWMRFRGDQQQPDEVLLIGGSSSSDGGGGRRRLCLDGQEILNARQGIGYLAVRRIGDELRVETDAEQSDLSFTHLLGANRITVNGKALPPNVTGSSGPSLDEPVMIGSK